MPDGDHMGLVAGLSIGAARQLVTAALKQAGIEDPARDARRLVEIASGLRAEQVLMQEARVLENAGLARLRSALSRRLAHEPVSRIAGERVFYGRPFKITPAVLDPRPETETLVDAVLSYLRAEQNGCDFNPRILDIGTGSGCLLLTLLAEIPGATGAGIDISPDALEIARANANVLGLDDRAAFELREARDAHLAAFDIVVSNPPYIPRGDIPALAPEVREFDPILALDGGEDGLGIYREITAAAATAGQRLIALEVGAGQACDVIEMFETGLGARVRSSRVHLDLGGIERCVVISTHF